MLDRLEGVGQGRNEEGREHDVGTGDGGAETPEAARGEECCTKSISKERFRFKE